MRWFLILLLALLVFNRFGDWAQRWGFGRLPGDFRFTLFGRQIFIPIASSIVLSLLAALLMHLI